MVGARAREAGAVAAGALQLVVGGEGVEGDAAGGGVVEAGAFGGVVGGEGAALLGGECVICLSKRAPLVYLLHLNAPPHFVAFHVVLYIVICFK